MNYPIIKEKFEMMTEYGSLVVKEPCTREELSQF